MTSKIDKTAIKNPLLDSRWKMLPCQKEMIPRWKLQGQSTKEIALRLGVSYHTVYYILNPDKLKESRDKCESGYSREKNTKTMAKHREKRRQIIKGQITYKAKLI